MTPTRVRAMRGLSGILLALAVFAPPALAVDPQRLISQYGHAAWRIQDGHVPGMPMALAQGPDGYLWIGTLNGLVRFDGVRFVRWSAPEGRPLPSEAVTRLLATADGGLWIGTQQGLSRWKDATLQTWPATPGGAVMAITEDAEHAIWITRTPRADAADQVCRVATSGEFACFGTDDGLALPTAPCCPAAFYVDPAGTTWIGSDTALTAWRDGASTVYALPVDQTKKDMGVTAIAPRAEGGLWVGVAKTGAGLGLQQFVDGEFVPFASGDIDGSTLPVSALRLDSRGALWIGTYGQGVYRLHAGTIDHFDSSDGLTADKVNAIFEDREGSVWVATAKGVDQFRDLRVASFAERQGLSSDAAATITAASDGSIWIGSAGLNVLRDGKVTLMAAADGLPDGQVTDVLQDHAGRLWVGVDKTLWIHEHDRFVPVRAQDGSNQIAYLVSFAEDAQHEVWARSTTALYRFRDGAVVDEYPLAPELMGRQIVADPQEGVWLGLATGSLARFRDGQAQVFDVALPPGASVNGFVEHMATTAAGEVLAATANGIVAWKDDKVQLLTSANGLPCNHAHALVVDQDGDLWALMQCGLVEIPRAAIDDWWANPAVRLPLKALDVHDGVDPGWAPFRGATIAPDGRLWFASGHGVQTLDPAATARNPVAPAVHIEALVADRHDYPLADGQTLPPLVRDLRIDFTATSFVIPQRVLFRYKLVGRDDDWQEPVTRRQAFYTDLPPGDYRFVVVASNHDGVWNQVGDSLSFRIPPAWHQTMGFRAGAILLLVLGAWFLARWRMRRLADAMGARFDERLGERLRIARELHDTLLQTVQAGKLVADDALSPTVDDERRRHALERISAWLGEAIADGRTALNALRRSTALRNDLADALQEAAEACIGDSGMAVRMSVAGQPREMHPIVRDEIYRIGYEAIRNATTHAHAKTLEIELAYAHDLNLAVRDDGIGITKTEAEQGKAGHFGLQGMRERAQRIGARLSIGLIASGGTEIRLRVPGRTIFR